MVKEKEQMKPVLITTEFRGVFFGYLKTDESPAKLTLTSARNCIYWSASVGGFLGLAANGPDSDCRIGKEVPEITLYKITSVTPVEEKAAAKWARA